MVGPVLAQYYIILNVHSERGTSAKLLNLNFHPLDVVSR